MKDFIDNLSSIVSAVDDFVWGPVMLILLVGTGVFLTIRTKCLPWRNLPYAIKSTLSKESRTTKRGEGDISPFSALTTALAATIGTGNIVGVATAMVSGGPGALVWMWISACFGLTSKFSECMLAIKYREVNEKGEMSGGPMYTMRRGLKNKKFGAILGWLFAFFAVVASFGIGNMTQSNSISDALHSTFNIPVSVTGIILTFLALIIIVGGIKTISKVSSVVVPLMAVFYIVCGLIVIICNIVNLPSGLAMIFKMAFSVKAVTGGALGTIVASMMRGMRFGVARGCFSNEAGMGSAAITAAAATTDHPVRQAYINMTGTFWDTLVVCTITGLCIASTGVLGATKTVDQGTYTFDNHKAIIEVFSQDKTIISEYDVTLSDGSTVTLSDSKSSLTLTNMEETPSTSLVGKWKDRDGNTYKFDTSGTYEKDELVKGSALTILAFEKVLGKLGGWLICIGITLFAFSTILGWEYHGEKAFEYLLGTHKYNMVYRIFFSCIVFVGATTTLDLVWNFSDIANALMAIPNLICMLLLSGEIAKDMQDFQVILKKEKKEKRN